MAAKSIQKEKPPRQAKSDSRALSNCYTSNRISKKWNKLGLAYQKVPWWR